MTIAPPAPGLYPDVPAEQYHAWEAASASRLKAMRRTPAHCREQTVNPRPPTPAFIMGDAAHLAVLQPELLDQRFTVSGKCSGTTGKGAACKNDGAIGRGGNWFCRLHDPGDSAGPIDTRRLLVPDDFDRVRRIADAVRAHRRAAEILAARKSFELSGVWDCPVTGVRCKLRTDLVSAFDDELLITDLKTTLDAGRDAFERDLYTLGYHLQGGHYTSGFAALGLVAQGFTIIAVEKEPPHGVAVYRLADEALDAGRDEAIRQLWRYRECELSGQWPAYPDDEQTISLPAWAWKKTA